MAWEIEYYRTAAGAVPFEEYLESLSTKLLAKTLRSLQLLKLEGTRLREPDTKPLGDGLFELRTSQGGEQGRSLFFFYDGGRVIVTHGFLKTTRKTPACEIARALSYRKDYLSRVAGRGSAHG